MMSVEQQSRLSWLELNQELWWLRQNWNQDAKEEQILRKKLTSLSQTYHIKVAQAQNMTQVLHRIRRIEPETHDHQSKLTMNEEFNLNDNIKLIKITAGQKKITKEYVEFINYLRTNPNHIALLEELFESQRKINAAKSKKLMQMLGEGNEVQSKLAGVRGMDSIAMTLTYSLYSNVYEKRENTLFREMFRTVLENEMKGKSGENKKKANPFTSIQSWDDEPTPLRVLILEHYFSRFASFIASIFREPVRRLYYENRQLDPDPAILIQGRTPKESPVALKDRKPLQQMTIKKDTLKSLSFRINPKKPPVTAEAQQHALKRTVSQPATNQNKETASKLNTHQARNRIKVTRRELCRACDGFVDALKESALLWEWELKVIIGDILRFSKMHWPTSYESDRIQIIAVIYTMMVMPALKQPHLSGIHSEKPPKVKVKHNLWVIVNIIQSIIIGDQFDTSHIWQSLNDYILKKNKKVRTVFKNFATLCENMPSLEASQKLYLSPAEPHLPEEMVFQPDVVLQIKEIQKITKIFFSKKQERLTSDPSCESLLNFSKLPQFNMVDGYLPLNVSSSIIRNEWVKDETRPQLAEIYRQITKYLKKKKETSTTTETTTTETTMPIDPFDVLLILVKTLLYLNVDLTVVCTTDTDLVTLLQYAKYAIKAKLVQATSDWESSAHLLTMTNELESILNNCSTKIKENGFLLLKEQVQDMFFWLRQHHADLWSKRQKRLRTAISQAQANVERVTIESDFVRDIVFHHRVGSFCQEAYSQYRIQLPPYVKLPPRVNREPNAGENIFYCDSVESFIAEYRQCKDVFIKQRKVGANLFHQFLHCIKGILQKDFGGKDTEVARAMDLIECYICNRLFSVMFSGDTSKESMDDEILERTIKSLYWVDPKELNLTGLSAERVLWQRSIDAIISLDDYRSPLQKINCLTMCIKWLAKILEVKSAGNDADTTLSSLIYVLLQAKPTRLRSNLTYIELFSRPDKLVGQDSYCLMQFSLAVSYISDTLDKTEREVEEQYPGHQRKTTLNPVDSTCLRKDLATGQPFLKFKCWGNLVPFLSLRARSVAVLVCHRWNTEIKPMLFSESVSTQQRETKPKLLKKTENQQNEPEDQKAVLKRILDNDTSAQKLLNHCRKEYCYPEFVSFYLEVEKYKILESGSSQQGRQARVLFDKFVREGSLEGVYEKVTMLDDDDNVSPTREEIKQAIEANSAFSNPLVGRTRSTSCVTSTSTTTSTVNPVNDAGDGALSPTRITVTPTDGMNASELTPTSSHIKDGLKSFTSLLKTKIPNTRHSFNINKGQSMDNDDQIQKGDQLRADIFDQLQSKAFSAMLLNVLSDFQKAQS